jgi:DNA mismatch endonuclease (patch repair protein)
MSYVFATTTSRSRNMRAIKANSNATTELRLRAHLIRNRVAGWKVRAKAVPGCPDFFFPNERIAVFVDGCFWHGCPKCGHTPKSNRTYWSKKLARNQQRDAQIRRKLRSSGIKVLRLWECQLRDDPSSCLERLFVLLRRSPGCLSITSSSVHFPTRPGKL